MGKERDGQKIRGDDTQVTAFHGLACSAKRMFCGKNALAFGKQMQQRANMIIFIRVYENLLSTH